MFALFASLLRPASREAQAGSHEVVGVVNCAGPFQLDGLPISETATIFQNSRIESTASVCNVRRTGGRSIRMQAGSGIVLTASGIQLVRGAVETTGDVSLTIAGAKSAIVPAPAGTTVRAQFTNSQFLVNVSSGSAVLAGPASEIYARLDAGTLMRAAAAPREPSGLLIWMRGCLAHDQDRWYIADPYTKRKVELLDDTIRKDRTRVGLWGSPQPMRKGTDNLASTLRVISEQNAQGGCRPFTPVHLPDDPAPHPGVGGAGTVIDMVTTPGQSGKLVNLP